MKLTVVTDIDLNATVFSGHLERPRIEAILNTWFGQDCPELLKHQDWEETNNGWIVFLGRDQGHQFVWTHTEVKEDPCSTTPSK